MGRMAGLFDALPVAAANRAGTKDGLESRPDISNEPGVCTTDALQNKRGARSLPCAREFLGRGQFVADLALDDFAERGVLGQKFFE